MKVGTKSLLFGVHQFLWHPATVWLAWWKQYYTFPTWRETVCIVIHDWGYFGQPNMNGVEGERHPELGAKIAGWLFGPEYHDLCLFHSRHYARNCSRVPSKLCWTDKGCVRFDPWWLYLPRAWLSGELDEYRADAARAGLLPIECSHRNWYAWLSKKFEDMATGGVVPYMNPERKYESTHK